MAKTNAELQRDFKRRSELTRLDVLIEGPAKRALDRLAVQRNVAMRVILQDLLLQAERDATAGMTAKARTDFYACKPVQTLPGKNFLPA